MSTVDTSTWNPDPDLNESLEGIPLNSEARIDQTWQAIRILMAAGGLHGLQLVPFTGATASADGKQGLVPAPEAGEQDKVLKGDGTWDALSASDIPNIDASKITSGTIDIARLPAGALERLVTVADQTARFALTTASVQLGDTVKQLDTGIMYIVVDTSKLGQAAGYVEYTAGSAASVPWSGVTGKPSSYTPSSHTHGSITSDGKLGTASRAVVTDGNKAIAVSSVTATELGYLSGVTSAVQTQLNAKVADSSVVHKTGDETVAGTKTFSSPIIGSIKKDPSGTSWRTAAIEGNAVVSPMNPGFGAVFNLPTKNYRVALTSWADNTDYIYLYSFDKTKLDDASYNSFKHSVSWNANNGTLLTESIIPKANNTSSLGSSDNKWANIYASTSTINTSDENEKDFIKNIPDEVLDAWEDVCFYSFKFKEAVENKSEKARWHSGVIAQRIHAVFKSHGLDAFEWGLLCRDAVPERDLDIWGVRYGEVLCMEAAYQRRRADRLEARIAAIEEAMNA